MRAILDALGADTSRWDFLPPRQWPRFFYSIGVTNELVRMLSQSQKISPGLPGLKPSLNSVLPVDWITTPATDASLSKKYYYYTANLYI